MAYYYEYANPNFFKWLNGKDLNYDELKELINSMNQDFEEYFNDDLFHELYHYFLNQLKNKKKN